MYMENYIRKDVFIREVFYIRNIQLRMTETVSGALHVRGAPVIGKHIFCNCDFVLDIHEVDGGVYENINGVLVLGE